jgi:hypothetical protein
MTKPNLKAVRDQLEIGDSVLVNPRNSGGAGALAHAKPRKARIVDLMGGAAAVQFEDDHREICTLKRLSKVIANDVDDKSALQPQPKPVAVVVAVAEPPKLAAKVPQDDVATWLEMGQALAAQMRAKIEAYRDEAVELRCEAHTLAELATTRDQDAEKLSKQLADIEKIAGMVPKAKT